MINRVHSRTCSLLAAWFVLVLAVPARAEPNQTAASAFDEGVELYEHARFAEAARAFLRADAAAPNAEALSNALAAARRANDHLLVATVAKRAVLRESTDPELAARARRALAEATPKLAALDLQCEPMPCTLSLDGQPVDPGSQYALPGNHAIVARAADAQAEEALNLEAGARYRIVLHPVKPGHGRRAAEISQRDREAPRPEEPEPKADKVDARPLAPGWFYAGAGVTVALIGATTWSGFDALSAKHDLSSTPTTSEVDSVRGKVRRTDILLAASALVGAATTYAGLELVHWDDTSVGGAAAPGGFWLSAHGRF